ncbi:histidinol-phosphate transaminase [Mesorhizobium sp.]|uniref:histidinol-phosphate transaminase n=1 Tax=Mesorhizobium sp. TaxID=1871066 RepID=UPI000FE3E4A4|nr:histidinol-phosphate transaminase [Mesorhizobium sp.]RWA96020.1 MAG: histidinol-phosphate transaminase [Mesorhizobium sp.]RWK57064.1 MAG: histidinol-phosphate transaminase [Mesorhizobium sp.]RWM41025.1 MAG: histidinol-phosphate transaminase [Mesorhizobium sp.]RWM44470.1 MAG: histidinol-phosphate transaminase [Mesorhizobium sp.]RWM45901.1 MAG: histidinol-phosphate transaminase [Mesorhizobium sp.]
MCDAKLKTVLSLFSQVARQLDALSSNGPVTDANCVKLNTNENPFPLPKNVMQSAIAAIEHQYLYPEDDNLSLREAASEAYGLSKNQVIAGNGSSELLGLIYRAFLAPGDRVAMLSPGFSFNRKLAMLQGAEFLEIASSEAHSLPIEKLLFGPAKDAKFILLANPNNPTGTFVPVAEIERLVELADRLIVLDEAYVDFAPDHALRLVNKHPNLLILRTFSKSYAAAGVRVGFGFGHPEIIGRLRNIQNVFNMNVIGQAVGKSILAHRHAYEENHKHIKHERQRVTLALLQLGFSVTPSHANFLLARVPAGQEGPCWQAALKEQKILIASFPDRYLKNCIRVSIGTKEQMDKFLAAAKHISVSFRRKSRCAEASRSEFALHGRCIM